MKSEIHGVESSPRLSWIPPVLKLFHLATKAPSSKGKYILKKFTWRGASVVQCLALSGQNAAINVTRIQD